MVAGANEELFAKRALDGDQTAVEALARAWLRPVYVIALLQTLDRRVQSKHSSTSPPRHRGRDLARLMDRAGVERHVAPFVVIVSAQ